jgi:hypothetical protein
MTSTMTSIPSVRWYRVLGGLLLLIGGLIMGFTVSDLPTAPKLNAVILFLGAGSLLLGLPALSFRKAKQVGWVGLLGMAIIWCDILVYPFQGGISGFLPEFNLPQFLFAIGPLTAVGTLLFGIATVRARVFPVWLCLCPFIGYLLAGIGNLLLSGTIALLVGDPGELLFWLSFSAFGILLFTERSSLESSSASVSPAAR